MLSWLGTHWDSILALAISAAALRVSVLAYQRRQRAEQVDNAFKVNAERREIWKEMRERPELARLLDGNLSQDTTPTLAEKLFLKDLILHTATAFGAAKRGTYFHEAGLPADLRRFLAKPIPRKVWEEIRTFLEEDFVCFVDKAMHD